LTHRYRAAGFTLDSDIAFSTLAPAPDAGAPAVIFRRCARDEVVGVGMVTRNFAYGAVDGRQVGVWTSDAATDEAVGRGVPIGALNAIAYQRGLLPLHAAAVAVGDTCVAFCGDADAGKSTLVAALARAGHRVICDDLLVLHPSPAGSLAWPADTRPKLTAASLALLGGGVEALSEPAAWDGKARTRPGAAAADAPRRLTAIYLLAWGDETRLTRLPALQAAGLMTRMLRKPEWLDRIEAARDVRQRWLELVAEVPVILATRPPGAAAFPDLPAALLGSWTAEEMR
jgi:hypothetical protein